MANDFRNRVALITGAGRGLGRDYALFLASRGASVVVNDLGVAGDGTGSSSLPADDVVTEIMSKGGKAVANYDSVSTTEGAENMVKVALDNFGTIDIVINNAGILRDKTFYKMTLEDFEVVIKVHLLGTFYVTKAAFPIMREKSYGRIVMITSTSALYGNFGQSNYDAAKMGVIGLMLALKEEGEKYNIKVNTVAPLAASRLGQGVFPEEFVANMKVELVTPLVAYFCSEHCQVSGDIVNAGLGFFAKSQMMQGLGHRFDPSQEITIEMIEENYPAIVNMQGGRTLKNATEAFLLVLEPFLKK